MMATTLIPRLRNCSATSIGTILQPLDEATNAESCGNKSKFRKIRSANPLTFSRNIACRWPFGPTTRLWKLSDSSTMGLKPGKDP